MVNTGIFHMCKGWFILPARNGVMGHLYFVCQFVCAKTVISDSDFIFDMHVTLNDLLVNEIEAWT